jgi:lysophospholipase L1-like esterase
MPRTSDEEPERRVSLAEFEENLHALFGFQPETPKLLITLFPVDPIRTGISPQTFRTYVETSKRIAEEYDIEILDIYARLGGICHAELLAEDGLHLNAQGYTWLTEQILPHLP